MSFGPVFMEMILQVIHVHRDNRKVKHYTRKVLRSADG